MDPLKEQIVTTLQEAQQTLMAVFLVPPMLLGILLMVFRDQVRRFLGILDFTQTLLIGTAVLAVACLGLLWAAIARFQRARLILD